MQINKDGKATVCIHLVVPQDESRQAWRIACMQQLSEAEMCQQHHRPTPLLRSDDIGAVTCANCQHTKEYLQIAAKSGRRV